MRLFCYFVVLFLCILCFFFFFCFFFQAEDGIRDLVRSRGLGDVYKRQAARRGVLPQAPPGALPRLGARRGGPHVEGADGAGRGPVSYTHLTLPTSDLV